MPTMQGFFAGSVAEAVTHARDNLKMLLVTTQDGQENSKVLDEAWGAADVQDALKGVVALRLVLEEHTEDIQNFVAFYPVAILPTVYFIGPAGNVLDCFFGVKTPTELVAAMTAALEKHTTEVARVQAAVAAAPPAAAAPAPVRPVSAPAQPAPAHAPRPVSAPQAAAVAGPAPASNFTEEERKQQLKDAVERARQKREADEAEREKQREAQRIELGKRALEVKRLKEQRELEGVKDEAKEARKRDKEEKARMKALLEQDKAERVAQRNRLQGGSTSAAPAPETPAPTTPKAEDSAGGFAALKEQVAAVAVRLTDGVIMRQDFKGDDTLADVQNYIDAARTDGNSLYSMMTNFPRRVFRSSEMGLTLAEVGLVPSGTLILTQRVADTDRPVGVPATAAVPFVEGGTCDGITDKVMGALRGAAGYFTGFLGGGGSSSASTATPAGEVTQGPVVPPASQTAGAGSVARRSGAGGRGQMRTMADMRANEDDDEEQEARKPPSKNKYWNGNSVEFGAGDDGEGNKR